MTVVRFAWLILCSFLSRNGEENVSSTCMDCMSLRPQCTYIYMYDVCSCPVQGWLGTGFGFGRLGTVLVNML